MTGENQGPTGPFTRRRGLQGSEHRVILVAGDLAASTFAVVVALWLWTITAGVSLPFALTTRAWWFLAAVAWSTGLAPSRNAHVAFSLPRTGKALVRLAAALLVAYLAVYFYAPRQALPRLLAIYFAWEAALLTLGWRLLYIWVFTETGFRRRAVIVGAGRAGRAVLNVMRSHGARDTDVVGFIDDDPGAADRLVDGIPVLGGSELLQEAAARHGVSEIILAVPAAGGELTGRLVGAQEAGIRVIPMSAVYEQALWRVPIDHLEPNWLFTSYAEAVSAKDASRLAKRLVDLVGGIVGSVACIVLVPFVALAVWIDSGLPIFFRQHRAGRAGRVFRLLKFRTMVSDAEADGQAQWAGPSDPRVTRVGRLLRRTRLDELPNFLNVLRGEMSLVGPRPERPEFVADLEHQIPFYRMRLVVRPGLTGWAQINYPYGDSVADAAAKLEYDLYYLKHRSLLFDLWILLRTVGTVVRFEGR